MKDNRLNEAMSINDITIKDLPKAIVMNNRELNIAKDQFRKTIEWSIMEDDFQILDVVEATKPKLLKNNVIYTLTLRPYLEDQDKDFLSQAANILKKLVINVFNKRNIKEALINAGLEAGSLILKRIVDILFMCEKLMREVCKTINSKSKYFRFYHIQTVLYNATNSEMTFHIQAFKRYRNLFIPDID